MMPRLIRGLICLTLLNSSVVFGDEPRVRINGRQAQSAEPDPTATSNGARFEFPDVNLDLQPQPSTYEPIPLTRDSTADGAKLGAKSVGPSIATILTALSVVVLLMLGIAKLFSRRNPFAAPGISRDAIDVLGRRTVDPRSSIYVVRVGGKVLLLGSSTNGLTTLSEITDPIEVATLTSLCRANENDATTVSGWFQSLLGRKVESRTFGERFGESLHSDAARLGQSVTGTTVRPVREGQHVV